MDDPQKYLEPLTLAKVRSLELQARLIVEGYLSGMHKSPYHGFSVEFAQHREYVPGDDIKHVDWKVYGRTGKFFLKQYEEETNLVCWLLLDLSESIRIGVGDQFRRERAPGSQKENGQFLDPVFALGVQQARPPFLARKIFSRQREFLEIIFQQQPGPLGIQASREHPQQILALSHRAFGIGQFPPQISQRTIRLRQYSMVRVVLGRLCRARAVAVSYWSSAHLIKQPVTVYHLDTEWALWSIRNVKIFGGEGGRRA